MNNIPLIDLKVPTSFVTSNAVTSGNNVHNKCMDNTTVYTRSNSICDHLQISYIDFVYDAFYVLMSRFNDQLFHINYISHNLAQLANHIGPRFQSEDRLIIFCSLKIIISESGKQCTLQAQCFIKMKTVSIRILQSRMIFFCFM